jgi:hypothetical protein
MQEEEEEGEEGENEEHPDLVPADRQPRPPCPLSVPRTAAAAAATWPL